MAGYSEVNYLLIIFVNRLNGRIADGKLELNCTVERFSFECRKVIGFAFATLHDWLRKLSPLFHLIRSKTKTNRDLLARVFPRFASATCNYFEF